jgi:pantoate--beta-alanine ligase
MIEINEPGAMLQWSRRTRANGSRLGLVPTMGFLHEGHLRLIDAARAEADAVVVSIFVNPIQFGPQEDLSRYPRDLECDRLIAERRGADCLFVPETSTMYRSDPLVRVTPGPLATHLCGRSRPGHFEGVLTVVAKLFNITAPDVAVFGRKDFQQARAIARMTEDLSIPVRIVTAPTVRELDGLALSSRNSYLNAAERVAAAKLPLGLEAAHAAFRTGETRSGYLKNAVLGVLEGDPLLDIEYIEIVAPDSLQPVESVDEHCVAAIAARVGRARLIDNVVLGLGIGGDETVSEPH